MSTWVLSRTATHSGHILPTPRSAPRALGSVWLFSSPRGPLLLPGTLLPCSPRLSHVTRPNPQWVSFASTPGC